MARKTEPTDRRTAPERASKVKRQTSPNRQPIPKPERDRENEGSRDQLRTQRSNRGPKPAQR